MTTGGNANGAGIAAAVSRRYQSLVLLLALLSGAGLFVAAGMRGADSWALFVVASVAALAASARLSSPAAIYWGQCRITETCAAGSDRGTLGPIAITASSTVGFSKRKSPPRLP